MPLPLSPNARVPLVGAVGVCLLPQACATATYLDIATGDGDERAEAFLHRLNNTRGGPTSVRSLLPLRCGLGFSRGWPLSAVLNEARTYCIVDGRRSCRRIVLEVSCRPCAVRVHESKLHSDGCLAARAHPPLQCMPCFARPHRRR